MEAVEELGPKRRPDVYGYTTQQLVQMALDLGITPTPQNREALLDAIEAHEEIPL